MRAKKDESRFTIKFNPGNPRHREAMWILNEAGRGKAALIADALCMYVRYGADVSADLFKGDMRTIVPFTQNAEAFKVSMASEFEDDASLDIMVDFVDAFFEQP